MKSGYYPITSNKVVWINDIYKSLQATYFDNVFLTEELLLYITDKYKVSPTYLEIEFTESVFFGSFQLNIAEHIKIETI